MEGGGIDLKTPLFEYHKTLGAYFIDFHGWEMPVRYSSIIKEHNAVRNASGLFDVSHMGKIEVMGWKAFDFIQKIVTNDISKLARNQALYTLMCYESGTIVDDLLVYKLDDDRFFLTVNALSKEKDLEWMRRNSETGVYIKDLTDELAIIAIQGPKSERILQKLLDYNLEGLDFFQIDEMRLDNVKIMVSRTGYTGEDGFEIYSAPDKIERVWERILQEGKDEGISPAGLGARDTLRLEAGYVLYGNDIDETTTPLEARLSWAVNFDKKDFIGKKKLQEQREKGVRKRLVGFEMIDRAIPRHGYKIFVGKDSVGYVTSGSFSPSLQKDIGLGYVSNEYTKSGEQIKIQIRNNQCLARIIKTPFYRRAC